jgi:alkylation response protein AidB-like acyl-CoA dehydrogenase
MPEKRNTLGAAEEIRTAPCLVGSEEMGTHQAERTIYKESLAERVSAFVQDRGQQSDEAGFNRDGWRSLARLGLFESFAQTPYSNVPRGLEELVNGLEALGRGDGMLGLAFSAGAHLFAVMSSIRKFGTDEQRRRWLPGMARGELIGAFGVAEPQGSSDAFALQSKARAGDCGYFFTGTKSYITNATVCDLALVFAHDDEAGRVVCAVVPRSTPGMETTGPIPTMGLGGSDLGRIELRNCFVPSRNVLALGLRAQLVFMHAMGWERGLIMAPVVGTMRRQIEECVRRARERRQGGAPLLALQAVRHRLADMDKRHYIASAALKDFLARKTAGQAAVREASLVKIIISDAFLDNSLDAMKLYGAFGYSMESRAQRDLRDSLAFQTASGTTDIQKNIVAEWMAMKIS